MREDDKGVKESLYKAQEYSDDPLEQLNWINEHDELTYKQKVMNMASITQVSFNNPEHKEIKLSNNEIDIIMRGIINTLNHMQEELPEGEYNYIYKRINQTLIEIMKKK